MTGSPSDHDPRGQDEATTLLAIETSTRTYSVGVFGIGAGERDAAAGAALSLEPLAEAEASTSHQDDGLLPVIDRVVTHSGLRIGDIGAIACGAGPGSFTGLRIGLATAKGLAYSTNRPLITISSLTALASLPTFGHSVVVACLDARKGEIFAAAFEVGGCNAVPRLLEPAVAIAPERLGDMTARLREQHESGSGHSAGQLHYVGNVLTAYPFLKELGEWQEATPAAKGVALLAAIRLFAQDTDDVVTSTPVYVRAPEIYPQPSQPLARHLHEVEPGKKP